MRSKYCVINYLKYIQIKQVSAAHERYEVNTKILVSCYTACEEAGIISLKTTELLANHNPENYILSGTGVYTTFYAMLNV